MFGHPSEHLLWAPNAQDDLAFTLYAEAEERDMAKNEIINRIANKNFSSDSNIYFSYFKEEMMRKVSYANCLDDWDWNDIYKYWEIKDW